MMSPKMAQERIGQVYYFIFQAGERAAFLGLNELLVRKQGEAGL